MRHMNPKPAPELEPEFVAELRLKLESHDAAAEDLLAGALVLSAMDYRALAMEYAARALQHAGRRNGPLMQTARALLMTGWSDRGQA